MNKKLTVWAVSSQGLVGPNTDGAADTRVTLRLCPAPCLRAEATTEAETRRELIDFPRNNFTTRLCLETSIRLLFICVLWDLSLRQRQFGSHSGKACYGMELQDECVIPWELHQEGRFLSLNELVSIWEHIPPKKCWFSIHKVALETQLNAVLPFWKGRVCREIFWGSCLHFAMDHLPVRLVLER